MSKSSYNTEGRRSSVPEATESHGRTAAANDRHRASLRDAVAGAWKQVLGLPRVGLDDNFFESGGTSLLATVLVSRINQALGAAGRAELPIASIFEHPTLRAMTRLIEGEAEPAAPAAMASSPATGGRALPSSAIAIIGMTGR